MRDETRLRFYVGDAEIYQFYFGDFELDEKYTSPFPHRTDPNPSFMFKNIGDHRNPKILWNDFGIDDIKYKDGIGFVMMFYDLDRKDAVEKIWNDMIEDKTVRVVKPKLKQPVKLPYEYKHSELCEFEMTYWKRFKFTKELLSFFNIWSLEYLRRGPKTIWESYEDNPTFIYLFSKEDAFKGYRPLSPIKDKFRGQNNGDVLEGYDQLPRSGDHLIIQSSLKDTATCRFMGLLGLNPTSENSKRALYTKIRELNQRFKNIYILFDNDPPGVRSAMNLARDTGWTPIFLPKHWSKDPSDIVEKAGTYYPLHTFFNGIGIQSFFNHKT